MGNTSTSLPYEIGEASYRFGHTGWSMHDGKKKNTEKEPISVFRFDKKNSGREMDMASNFFRLTKTLRHPHVLAFADGIDTESEYSIVTESVIPLRTLLLDGALSPEAVIWGLHCIFQALEFVNNSCKLVHGNVSPESIFVTKGGDWKLSGFFIAGTMDTGGPCMLFREWSSILEAKYKAPERAQNNWNALNTANSSPAAIDVWSLACVMRECFYGLNQGGEDCAKMPGPMQSMYKQMHNGSPKNRPSCGTLFASPEFKRLSQNPFSAALEFLEEFPLKSDAEKMGFAKGLSSQLARFPKNACCYKILPVLIGSLSAPAPPQQPNAKRALSPMAPVLIGPILQIGAMLEDPVLYNAQITPALVQLFSSNDRSIRCVLLSGIGDIVKKLDTKTVSTQIFPSIATGFTDTVPQLRELTVKSIVSIAPLLDDKTLNESLLRYIVTLLKDSEAPIRTNTLICLNRIFEKFDSKTQMKIVVGMYVNSLRDPFVPARLAAIRGLGAAPDILKNNPEALGQKIMPQLVVSLVDSNPEVRATAFQQVEKIVEILKSWSDKRATEQKIEEEEKKRQAQADVAKVGELPDKTLASSGSSSMLSSWTGGLGWPTSKTPEPMEVPPKAPSPMPTSSTYTPPPQPMMASNTFSVPAPAPVAARPPAHSVGKGMSLLAPNNAANANPFGDDGWGDNDDDDDLFNMTSSSVKKTNVASLKSSTNDFFDTTPNKTTPTASLGLKSPNTLQAPEARRVTAEKKREEARARIAQKKEARKQGTKPTVIKKATDGDGWDDF